MLWIPRQGNSATESNITSAAAYSTTATADATSHTKGAYSDLIASTAYNAYGITIIVSATATAASTNARCLVDVATGAASSEIDIVPNLLAGNLAALTGNSFGSAYHFPIFIPAGTRLSTRCQGLISSETVLVTVYLHHHQVPGKWYGSRVTAYGPDTATSSGTAHTGANGSYATTTQITASSTNPIKYLQMGVDMGTDTTNVSTLILARIAAMGSTNYIVSDLIVGQNTTTESMYFTIANFVLSHMAFNIPAGQYLGVGVRWNTTAEVRGHALYGVD